MSKWVEVPVVIMKIYAVEIEDNETVENAINYAMEDCMCGENVEIDYSNVVVSENEHQAEQIRRFADELISL